MDKNFHDDEYTLAAETYYRVTQKLHEFAFDTTSTHQLSDVALSGEGTVYGAEFTISKRTGNLSGSIRYSLSWVQNRFAEVNGGNPYTPWFERKHELYASLSYSVHEYWSVGMLCLVSTNHPFGSEDSKAFNATVVRNEGFTSDAKSAYSADLNGGRLPGFQRLELYVTHKFSSWGLPFQATLRMLNGYGLLDPFVWELRDSPDTRQKWRATFDASDLFPLYPVVNMSVRF